MPQTALLAALVAGLVGGLHCIAMCGGFVAAVSTAAPATAPLLPLRALVFRQVIAHAGRLVSYAIAGAVFGGLGGVALAAQWSPLQRTLYVVANLLLIVLAVALALRRSPFAAFERAGLALYRRLLPHTVARIRSPTLASRFILGLLWGMTPCALVYGVLPLAAFAGSAPAGALVMLAFGVGTLPNLALAGAALQRGARWLDRPLARHAASLLIAAFGIAGLYRVLFVPDALAHGPFCFVP
jgi:sulfite exporter TauE/SafE